jgi:hypothetical protein
MRIPATSLAIIGLGVAVTALGLTKVKGNIGSGLAGFGLAHVILGFLDALRGTVQD